MNQFSGKNHCNFKYFVFQLGLGLGLTLMDALCSIRGDNRLTPVNGCMNEWVERWWQILSKGVRTTTAWSIPVGCRRTGAWNTTWCLLFLFEVKGWYCEQGKGCESEGESKRCLSLFLQQILNLTRAQQKCFLYCPMWHCLSREFKESFPLISISINVLFSKQFVQTICSILSCDLHTKSHTPCVYFAADNTKQSKYHASACHTQKLLLVIELGLLDKETLQIYWRYQQFIKKFNNDLFE